MDKCKECIQETVLSLRNNYEVKINKSKAVLEVMDKRRIFFLIKKIKAVFMGGGGGKDPFNKIVGSFPTEETSFVCLVLFVDLFIV